MYYRPPPDVIAQLMRFVAKKSEDVESPMNIRKLCRQFKEETRSVVSENCWRERIHSNRNRIHEMSEFDMDTKVKMMFALSAPVDKGFLNKLKKHAEIEVDDKRRIIRFKKTGGGLELNGRHRVSSMQINKRDREMLQFLVEKAKTEMTPIADTIFVRKYKAKTGDTKSLHALLKIYSRLKSTIYELPGIEKITKVKMMFISHAKLSDYILEELRTDAYVEVDGQRKMRRYEAIDGSLELEGDHSRSAMWKAAKAYNKRKCLAEKERKQAREGSEEDGDGASLNVEDESPMDFETHNVEAYYYEPPIYKDIIDHISVEKKPELLLEIKKEVPEMPSTSNGGYRYEDNFFDIDPPNYEEDMDHILVEKKPENLIEAKIEVPEEPSTSNLEYYYEENLEHAFIKPKQEID